MAGRFPPPGGRLLPSAALVAALAAAWGCMPWAAGQPAATLPPETTSWGVGVAGLVDHREWSSPLPVPQLWVRRGLGSRTDAGLAYALPGTLFGDVKRRVGEGGTTRTALSGGLGLHTVVIPEDLGGGGVGWIPFAAGGVLVDRGGAEEEGAPFPYGQLRLFAPFHVGDDVAATLWLAPTVGWHRSRGRVEWGPELGVVVSAADPSRWFLVGALSLRWG